MILFLYVLCVVAVYICLRLAKYAVYQYGLYQQMKHFPGPPMPYGPIVGHLTLLWEIIGDTRYQGVGKRFYQKMTELCDTYAGETGFVMLWLGPFSPWIVVADAKLARRVLTSRYHMNKATYYRIMETFATGTSLFTSSAPEARRERRLLKEHFTLRYLDSYIPKMERHQKQLVQKIDRCISQDGGYYPDINNLVSTFIYDTVGDNLFSSHFSSIATGIEPPYVTAIHEMIVWLETAIIQPWRYLWASKTFLVLVNAFNHMFFTYTPYALKSIFRYHSCVYDIVQRRYDQLKNSLDLVDHEKPSLIDRLLVSRVFNRKGRHSSYFTRLAGFIDVMWHMDMFIVAGHDTSTASITWTLYMLAHHPEVQEKARQEVDQFLEQLAQTGESPNQLNLKRLPYLECCIKETLRLYPVAPFLGRNATAPLPVADGLVLPADIDITVFYDYAHRQEKYFPKPEAFIPERYQVGGAELDSGRSSPNANQIIFPFSLGERGCLGKQYAMSQMKLLFITLLSKYEITPLDKVGDVVEEHHFLTKPPNFPVQFKKRDCS